MQMVGFMASRTGRWVRIMAGAGLVLGGLVSGKPRGAAVALAGLVPLLAASLDVCLLGPLFGLPLKGEDIRRRLGDFDEATLLHGSPQRVTSTFLH